MAHPLNMLSMYLFYEEKSPCNFLKQNNNDKRNKKCHLMSKVKLVLMKTLIILIITFYSKSAFSQFPIDNETGLVKYSKVIDLPGITKKEIYDKAKLWIVSTLKSGDNMVELSGSNSDQIVGTGNIIIDSLLFDIRSNNKWYTVGNLNFKFIIYCKDEKLKYSVENFLLRKGKLTSNYNEFKLETYDEKINIKNNELREQFIEYNTNLINKEVKLLTSKLINYMTKTDSNDW